MIKILPQELINQIAAGEVIERPASVVKELVENSLDAGATKIIVSCENGGLNEIRVIDNGSGMSREDVLMSIEQHATSKISGADDLFKIQTLGFRGEALASIASVSEFSMASRRADDLVGSRLSVVGVEKKIEDIGCPVGTTVCCRNLFFNVPARKKYLKNAVTEYNHIADLFLNYALAHPSLDWTLTHNGREVYHFGAAANPLERCEEIFGKEICANLLPVEYETLYIKISGFVGKPQIARQNKKLQYLFVNSRPVNEFVVAKTVKDSFGQLIPRELYPIYLLRLEVDPTKIDVNVHPRKLEVRFSEPHLIYQAFYKAVTELIDQSDLVKKISFNDVEPLDIATGALSNTCHSERRTASGWTQSRNLLDPSAMLGLPVGEAGMTSIKNFGQRSQPIPVGFIELAEKKAEWPYQFLGQVANCYLIISDEKGVKIIDQHAASERIQYEKLSAEWRAGKIASQRIMFPQSLELSLAEAGALKQNLSFFVKLGFEIDEFGANTFLVRQVPGLLAKVEISEIVQEILKMISDEASAKSDEDRFIVLSDDILKMMSCKSAIKFGDKLAAVEAMALLDELFKLANRYTCVHGRPCIVEFTFSELEKLFKRK
jgi:DNA mismatch repair protein MutL